MSDFQEFLEQALQKTINTHKYFNNEYSFQIELIVQMRFLTDSNSKFSGFYVVPEYSNKDDIDNGGINESGRLDILIRDNEDQFCVIELKHKCKANSWKIPSAKKDKDNGSSLSLKGGKHDRYELGFPQIEKDFKRCSNLLDSKAIKEAYLVLLTNVDEYINRDSESVWNEYFSDKGVRIKNAIEKDYTCLNQEKNNEYKIIIFEIDP